MSGSGFLNFNRDKSSSRTKDITPAEFRSLRPEIAGSLLSLIRSEGGEFEGPFVAPLGDAEAAALWDIEGAVAPSGSEVLSRDLLDRSLRGEFLDPESNPFLAATIEAAIRPIRQEFEEGELLDRALFSRSGHRIQESSPFSRARGIATRGLLDAIGDVSANIAAGNFQAERDRQGQAVDRAAALDQLQFERQAQNLQAQALPRLIEDLGIERGLEEFRRRMDLLRDVLGIGVEASSRFGQFSRRFAFGAGSGGGGGVGGGGAPSGGGGGVT